MNTHAAPPSLLSKPTLASSVIWALAFAVRTFTPKPLSSNCRRACPLACVCCPTALLFSSASHVRGKVPSGYKHLMAQFHQFILPVVCPHQRHHLLVCFNLFVISLAGIPSLEGRFCQHGGNATAPPYRWTDMDDLSINGGQTAKTMTTSQSKRYEIQINKVL